MAKTIVVYGATMAGVAAAAKAAKNAPSATIHLIVPDPVDYNGNGCASAHWHGGWTELF